MRFADILSTLLLSPLELVFDFIFHLSVRLLGSPGRAIFALSVTINLLLMPLYRQADAMQQAEREMEKRLEKGIAHIKKTFQGDERMMILQAYYRENHYKPTYALRSAAPLLLQIPFFLAAYRFLSGLTVMQQMPFGIISNLSSPDGLLRLGDVTINLLPFLMTLINLASGMIFSQGGSRREKIQLYGMALFFLVFLYNSPSCLVLYWTLNNLFSLIKNICLRYPVCYRYWKAAASVLALFAALFGLLTWRRHSLTRLLVCLTFCVLVHAVLLILYLKKKWSQPPPPAAKDAPYLPLGAVYLAVFLGLLIPTNVIVASPSEFVDALFFYHPLWFVVSTACLALGIFVLWTGVFYRMSSPNTRSKIQRVMLILFGAATVNYMFFGTNLGTLSTYLVYDKDLAFTTAEIIQNLLVTALVCAALAFALTRFEKQTKFILSVCAAAMVCLSGWNALQIHAAVSDIALRMQEEQEEFPGFSLSKTGKNVVMIMLDRGMDTYIPYFFNENPQLAQQYSGFTHYNNNISFGFCTKVGVPPLYGGYEYTPASINSRTGQTVKEKHNEALKMMPALFSENGCQVTVLDPPHANYQVEPDLSIFDGMENVQAYNTMQNISEAGSVVNMQRIIQRNLFCFGLTKCAPLAAQGLLYENGNYNQSDTLSAQGAGIQIAVNPHIATGIRSSFLGSYHILQELPNSTLITDDPTTQVLLMANKTTHEPMLLQEPGYTPEQYVDNTEYDLQNEDRFTVNGRRLNIDTVERYASYQCNMAALIQIGNWLDYLRENDVYDNTRILIVSDHGREIFQSKDLLLDDGTDLQQFHALLMVKDFDSSGPWQSSDEFMTQADVPTLALEGIVENPTNPFTGNPISSDAKYQQQFIYLPEDSNFIDSGDQFLPGAWYAMQDSIWNPGNWKYLGKNLVIQNER